MPFGPRLQISSLFKHRSIIFYEELDNFEINHRFISPASFKGIENKEATEASCHQFRPQISFLQESVLSNTLDYFTLSLLIVAKRKKNSQKYQFFCKSREVNRITQKLCPRESRGGHETGKEVTLREWKDEVQVAQLGFNGVKSNCGILQINSYDLQISSNTNLPSVVLFEWSRWTEGRFPYRD